MSLRLMRESDGIALLENIEVAASFWQRFKGLQLRRSLPIGTGFQLSPCSSIHTCFMRFPIDVLMLDQNNVVLCIRRNVRPWRAVICVSGTKSVIETNVNAVDIQPETTIIYSYG